MKGKRIEEELKAKATTGLTIYRRVESGGLKEENQQWVPLEFVLTILHKEGGEIVGR